LALRKIARAVNSGISAWHRDGGLPISAAEDLVLALADREPPKGVQLLNQVAALH
jgi:hypothetical protein